MAEDVEHQLKSPEYLGDRPPLFENVENEKSYLQVYVELKREQQSIEEKLERIKGLAFEQAGETLGGETKGQAFGAHIELRYRNVWQYSEKYETKKKALDALKKYEEKSGRASLVQTSGYIMVSFKEKG